MSEWIRIIIGFLVSIIGGHAITWPLVEKYLWPHIKGKSHAPGSFFHPKGLTWLTGMVERALYTAAFCLGGLGLEWIGVWLGIKVIARWQNEQRRVSKEKVETGEPEQTDYDVWLIGSAVSLACAFLGACVALGHRVVIGFQK